MSDTTAASAFAPIIAHFTEAARTRLAATLASLSPAIDAEEVELVRAAAEQALLDSAALKLNRVLLLELHAAQRAGELEGGDDAARYAVFVERARQAAFSEHLRRRYPLLFERLGTALARQRQALETLAMRFAADRDVLASLMGRLPGRLLGISLGQGDLHAGGQTVALLTMEGGRVAYKPRSLRIDLALEDFIARVFGSEPDRIRVPAAIDRGDYGWSEFIVHRYCTDDAELRRFYRNLGDWLAVLRLLGGTDIHHENLIAEGPVPVAVDVESLFAKIFEVEPTGRGNAHDLALNLVCNSVQRTGIVPFRAVGLGYEGVDLSAAGGLPDQQPKVHAPIIVDAGTPHARLQIVDVDVVRAQNHPSADPDVSRFWDDISAGFVATTERLRALDVDGTIPRLLQQFDGCPIRDIRRPTQAYTELTRMLWHPASLHDEAKAIERVRDLLQRNAAVMRTAPSTPEEISGEIEDMRHGDVPIFVGSLSQTQIDKALADWRAMRVELEELTIRSALVATDLNQRMREREEERRGLLYIARHPHASDLDVRRRRLASAAVERLLRLAVRGNDGSVTWISPEIGHGGWLVQPVQADLYSGLGGIAIALAGYRQEVAANRADEVDGMDDALAGTLNGMLKAQALAPPTTVGAFSGHGARIWTWLTLHDALRQPEFLAHAIDCAEALEREGFDSDLHFDIIDGASGAIVPLLTLAEATGDPRWLALAAAAAHRLESTAVVDARGARWFIPGTDEPIGGFAHGAAGMAWALLRLALAGAGREGDRARWRTLAAQALDFQDSLYDEASGNWLDLRPECVGSFHAWCNGSVGIGLMAGDLYARSRDPRQLGMLRRAVAAARNQWGSSHTLCHGDLSLWELLVRASSWDPEGCTGDPVDATALVVSSIEEHRGMIGGLTRAAFTPGLMTGLAGAIHGLNRMHPKCTLPSPLLLERRALAA